MQRAARVKHDYLHFMSSVLQFKEFVVKSYKFLGGRLSETVTEADVIVVGGGHAGLAAAA